MSDDSMSAAATVLAAADGGMKGKGEEREGVHEDQYGGEAQYFAGPPMQ